MMIGHCAGAMMFDFTGITKVKKSLSIRWPNLPFKTELPRMKNLR